MIFKALVSGGPRRPPPAARGTALALTCWSRHAHQAEPKSRTAQAEVMYTRFAPNRRAAQPVIGITAASNSRYPVTAHWICAIELCRSCPSVRSATLTIVGVEDRHDHPRGSPRRRSSIRTALWAAEASGWKLALGVGAGGVIGYRKFRYRSFFLQGPCAQDHTNVRNAPPRPGRPFSRCGPSPAGAPVKTPERRVGDLPAVVGEGLVGLRHAVDVVLALVRPALL